VPVLVHYLLRGEHEEHSGTTDGRRSIFGRITGGFNRGFEWGGKLPSLAAAARRNGPRISKDYSQRAQGRSNTLAAYRETRNTREEQLVEVTDAARLARLSLSEKQLLASSRRVSRWSSSTEFWEEGGDNVDLQVKGKKQW
jgi:hypothetical protein